jgi:hypothetical protein
MIVRNQRARALAGATGLATAAARYIAKKAINGGVNGLATRAYNAAQRYARGDVSQPRTALTAQQLQPIRASGRRFARGRFATSGSASVIERGSLKLADVSTVAGNSTGACISSIPLLCETIGGRLFAMSKLYSRWKFDSAILRYVPAVSSSTDGSLVVFYTQEPDDSYNVNEPVGSQNATSAIDNMEFSVREKMSMKLHVNPQLLYTTPSTLEKSWHSGGVVNVINNGALVVSKTYGSLYMDFVVTFTQPCAPFDPYSPLYTKLGFLPSGSGATGPGVAGGALLRWSVDANGLGPASGPQWLIDPATGVNGLYGKIFLPPYSSAFVVLSLVDSAGIASSGISPVWDSGVSSFGQSTVMSTDHTGKWFSAVITNTNAYTAGFQLTAGALGYTVTSATMSVDAIPYTTA